MTETHTLIRLHKRSHLGFLSYQAARAGQRFVLQRKKGALVWIVHANVCVEHCVRMRTHFLSFSLFLGHCKIWPNLTLITQMRLLFLAQWGLRLIREGTKCCFSSCLAVWGLKEVKEGQGKTGSGGNSGFLAATGASTTRLEDPTAFSYRFACLIVCFRAKMQHC